MFEKDKLRKYWEHGQEEKSEVLDKWVPKIRIERGLSIINCPFSPTLASSGNKYTHYILITIYPITIYQNY